MRDPEFVDEFLEPGVRRALGGTTQLPVGRSGDVDQMLGVPPGD